MLSADLRRSTELVAGLDPEAAVARLEPALAAMRIAVRRDGGIVSKEQGDGLIALFGAPRADDNHSVMACHAAVELIRRVEALHDPALRVRVGIHSGYAITRVIQGDYSSVYEAGGPAMHLVERLQEAAEPGQILVSQSCQALSEERVTFEELAPVALKGFPHPVLVYRLDGMSALSRWQARADRSHAGFVNRFTEIATLGRAAEEATAASGQIVSLVGDPGVGKSRLAFEFVDGLRRAGWQTVDAACDPTTRQIPYALVKRLLGDAMDPGEGCGDAGGKLVLSPEPALPDLWRAALQATLERKVDDPTWQELEPIMRRRAVIDMARAVVSYVARQRRTVLLLEDLHWIDSESEAVLAALAPLAAEHPLLMLVTSRPEASLHWLHGRDVSRVSLRPLDEPAATALLDGLLGPAPELAGLKARVLRHTGRVPLFMEEVTRQLLEGRAANAGGALAAGAAWDELGIPPTVQGVIASRIDRQSKEAKALLQLAAVIGPRVSPRLLQVTSDLPEAALARELASLEAAELLVEARGTAAPEYKFPHDLIREVASDLVLRQQRQDLHERILSGLETLAAGAPVETPEIACHHAVAAQLWPKVGVYGHLAAQKCLDRSAFGDAARYFETAMDAVDRLPKSTEREAQAIDLRIEARLAFSRLGQIERWHELGREAVRRAGSIDDPRRQLAADAVLASALNFYGTPDEAIAAGERAVLRADRMKADGWLGFAEYHLGQAYGFAGRHREAELLLEKAYQRLSSTLDTVPLGTTGPSLRLLCCLVKATTHVVLGEPDLAEAYERLASELAEHSNRVYDRIAAAYGRGQVRLFRGDFAAAKHAHAEAVELSRQYETRQFLPLLGCQLGHLHLQQGRAAEARTALLEAKAEAEAIGHRWAGLLAQATLATALTRLGDVEGGLELARATRATARQQGAALLEVIALTAEATSLGLRREPDTAGAKRCLHAAIELATRIEARTLLAAAKVLLARLVGREGDGREAGALLRQAVDLFDTMKMTVPLERAKVALAALPKS